MNLPDIRGPQSRFRRMYVLIESGSSLYSDGIGHGRRDRGRKAIVLTSSGTMLTVRNMKDV